MHFFSIPLKAGVLLLLLEEEQLVCMFCYREESINYKLIYHGNIAVCRIQNV